MTFAALRRSVLENQILSTDWFAEEVTYTPRGGTAATVTVKIEVETKPRREGPRPGGRDEVDTTERIRVLVSRDEDVAGGAIVDTPAIGAQLVRAEAADSDTRPYTFTGEVLARSPWHAVYVFERARRVFDARR